LQYTLDNFEADHSFTNLKETKHYDYMFTTLKDELEVKGKISIPSLLGFDNADNVIYLRTKVIEKYSSLINFPAPVDLDEDTNPKILAAKKTNERATKAMKCKGNEISNTALEKNVQKGVHQSKIISSVFRGGTNSSKISTSLSLCN
ncbi:18906_t:CDS:2, partial [Entrophospora sp. SA101]